MKRTVVRYVKDYDEAGRWWSDLEPEQVTGRYQFIKDKMFIEIEETHHFLWLHYWKSKRWIGEDSIEFREEEIFTCSGR